MRRRGKRVLLDWGKNALIVLLLLSALYLVGQVQFYTDGLAAGGDGFWGGIRAWFSPAEPESVATINTWTQGVLPRPGAVVLSGNQGRAGFYYDDETVGQIFGEFVNPLADALADAQAPIQTTAQAFQAALAEKAPGIYLDFMGAIPLQNLAAWLSGGYATGGALDGSVQRMLLTVSANGVVMLYYINADTGLYYACRTADDLAERLQRLTEDLQPNGVFFAFEGEAPYRELAPYVLLGGETVRLGQYLAENPVALTSESAYNPALEALIRRLSFHPQAASYLTRDGVVLQEGSEKLRISNTGQIVYEAANTEAPRFALGGGEGLKHWEIVGSVWNFVEQALSPLCGQAHLYLSDIAQTEDGATRITVSYQIDGAPVLVGADGYAAQVEVSDGAITGFWMQVRSYVYQDTGPAVLPELQAAAVLSGLRQRNAELTLYYADGYETAVSAAWGAALPHGGSGLEWPGQS